LIFSGVIVKTLKVEENWIIHKPRTVLWIRLQSRGLIANYQGAKLKTKRRGNFLIKAKRQILSDQTENDRSHPKTTPFQRRLFIFFFFLPDREKKGRPAGAPRGVSITTVTVMWVRFVCFTNAWHSLALYKPEKSHKKKGENWGGTNQRSREEEEKKQ
jgi:hypothetical protein